MLVSSFFLKLRKHINMPTRTTIKTRTLIDIINAKIDDAKTIRSRVMKLGITGHNMVYVCRKKEIPKYCPKFVETRQLNTLI